MAGTNGKRCIECGAVGVPADDDRCKPCRIGHESGPQARKDYLSTVGRKGGQARAKGRDGIHPDDLGALETAEDAKRWAHVIALALATGDIGAGRANALRSLLREWRDAHESYLTEAKMEALEEKLDELERAGVV